MKNKNEVETNSNVELFSVGIAIGFVLGVMAYKYAQEKGLICNKEDKKE